MNETRQERFDAPPRAVRFDETESAVTRRVFWCDGHAYENMIEYDLSEAFDRLAFERKLDTFIEWFEEAQERSDSRVYVDDDEGRRVFRCGKTLILCSVKERSHRIRQVYFTVQPIGG